MRKGIRAVLGMVAMALVINACASAPPKDVMLTSAQSAGSAGSNSTQCLGSVVVHVSNTLSIPVVVTSRSSSGGKTEFWADPGVSDVTLPRGERLASVIPDPLSVNRKGGPDPSMYKRVSYATRCESGT